MTTFDGILNNNGCEMQIRMRIQINETESYTTAAYIDGEKYDCLVNYDSITLQQITYIIAIKSTDEEIIIIGREPKKFYHFICFWFCQPNFFVLTNKLQV